MKKLLTSLLTFAYFIIISPVILADELSKCIDQLKAIPFQNIAGINLDRNYETLMRNKAYEAVIKKYTIEYRSENSDSLAEFYVSDALISLALLKTNNPSLPKSTMVLIEEKNIINFDLHRALSETSPDIWPNNISKLYGAPNICMLKKIFSEKQKIYDYQKRYIAVMISMGEFAQAINETKKMRIRSITVDDFSQVGEVFIALRRPIEAARFIKVLKNRHDLSGDKLEYWSIFIHRFISIEKYSQEERKKLHLQVSRILNANS